MVQEADRTPIRFRKGSPPEINKSLNIHNKERILKGAKEESHFTEENYRNVQHLENLNREVLELNGIIRQMNQRGIDKHFNQT